MTRRGHFLVECMVAIFILGMVLEIGLHGFELLNAGPLSDGGSRHLDRVCDRLRQDLRHGGSWNDDQLVTGAHRWHIRDGRLLRDGVDQIAILDLTVDHDELIVRCPGLASRRLGLRP